MVQIVTAEGKTPRTDGNDVRGPAVRRLPPPPSCADQHDMVRSSPGSVKR